MWSPLRRWLLDLTDAPSAGRALRYLAEYAAIRLWALVIGCFPINTNLATARWLGRLWWWLIPRHRDRALDNLRPSLGSRYSEADLRRIARQSMEHFVELYSVEFLLTPRLINPWSWSRYVELGNLGPALRELLSGRGVILLTGHFGNYELLGATLCRLGLPLTAIMRPLDNPLINTFLVRSREVTGLKLLYKKGATAAASEVLARGGTLCFIADQDAGRKGLFVDFFGRKASTYKSIGLLAMQHRVPIIVGSATRLRSGFSYRIDVERIIQPTEWEQRADPLLWITQEFTRALENAIRRAPEQYLWVHRRWKHQPKPTPRRRSSANNEPAGPAQPSEPGRA